MGELPAYPVRVACEALADPHLEGKALLSAMAAASGVFYNHTHELECFDYKVGPNKESDEDEMLFSYQVQAIALS
jgi:lysosomal Pro-X carboxypeptidase